MSRKLTKWFIFSVLVGLVPIGWSALHALTQGDSISWGLLCSRGELLLIGSAIASGAIGELFVSGSDMPTFKLICGGGCVLCLMIDSLWFADISDYLATGKIYDTGVVARGSLILFICNLMSAMGCVILAED